ncbi:hypothetical protein [Flyfo siphovirus Tbat2_3]|nr:hypothetical protein [Flyfo siphovirus Tbat2_3]
MSYESIYCPYCQREIEPQCDTKGEVIVVDGGHIYLHDDVIHDDDYNGQTIQ